MRADANAGRARAAAGGGAARRSPSAAARCSGISAMSEGARQSQGMAAASAPGPGAWRAPRSAAAALGEPSGAQPGGGPRAAPAAGGSSRCRRRRQPTAACANPDRPRRPSAASLGLAHATVLDALRCNALHPRRDATRRRRAPAPHGADDRLLPADAAALLRRPGQPAHRARPADRAARDLAGAGGLYSHGPSLRLRGEPERSRCSGDTWSAGCWSGTPRTTGGCSPFSSGGSSSSCPSC